MTLVPSVELSALIRARELRRMLRRNGVGIGGMAEGQNEIARLARLTGGVENRAVVVAQDLQPIGDVIGVAHLRDNVQMRAEKRACQFRDEFFARIRLA